MKNFFSKKVDFTPLKVLFSILAISFVGMISDVSAMTQKADMFRPDLVNLKDELKMCPVPFSADHCRSEGKQVNFCQDQSGNLLQSLNLNPFLGNGMKPYCSTQGTSGARQNES